MVLVALVLAVVSVVFAPKPISPAPVTLTVSETPTPTPDPLYIGWESYVSQNLGLEFFYPPQFRNYDQGSFTEIFRAGNKSAEICINLSGCVAGRPSFFSVHSVSEGWQPKAGFTFSDIASYRQEEAKYFAVFPDNSELELPQTQVSLVTTRSGENVLVIKGFPADSMGAIINKSFPDFHSLVFQMHLTDDLTENDFLKLINSLNFPYYNIFPSDAAISRETLPQRYVDATITTAIAKIAKILNCRFVKSGSYPVTYLPDYFCGGTSVITNPVIQKPYYYSPTNDGRGFILKAKLSTDQIYTVTEADYPPPTPVPSPTPRFR